MTKEVNSDLFCHYAKLLNKRITLFFLKFMIVNVFNLHVVRFNMSSELPSTEFLHQNQPRLTVFRHPKFQIRRGYLKSGR